MHVASVLVINNQNYCKMKSHDEWRSKRLSMLDKLNWTGSKKKKIDGYNFHKSEIWSHSVTQIIRTNFKFI